MNDYTPDRTEKRVGDIVYLNSEWPAMSAIDRQMHDEKRVGVVTQGGSYIDVSWLEKDAQITGNDTLSGYRSRALNSTRFTKTNINVGPQPGEKYVLKPSAMVRGDFLNKAKTYRTEFTVISADSLLTTDQIAFKASSFGRTDNFYWSPYWVRDNMERIAAVNNVNDHKSTPPPARTSRRESLIATEENKLERDKANRERLLLERQSLELEINRANGDINESIGIIAALKRGW